jgi:hypothetical protein
MRVAGVLGLVESCFKARPCFLMTSVRPIQISLQYFRRHSSGAVSSKQLTEQTVKSPRSSRKNNPQLRHFSEWEAVGSPQTSQRSAKYTDDPDLCLLRAIDLCSTCGRSSLTQTVKDPHKSPHSEILVEVADSL